MNLINEVGFLCVQMEGEVDYLDLVLETLTLIVEYEDELSIRLRGTAHQEGAVLY